MAGDDSGLLGSADESGLQVEEPHDHAAGLTAVKVAMQRALGQMGPDYEQRVVQRSGFVLPHPPRDSRSFTTPSGRAHSHGLDDETFRCRPATW